MIKIYLIIISVDSFVSYSGERFDVIVNANQDIDNYWIRFRGMLSCARNKAHQVAVLHYVGANMDEYPAGVPSYETSKREGVVSAKSCTSYIRGK